MNTRNPQYLNALSTYPGAFTFTNAIQGKKSDLDSGEHIEWAFNTASIAFLTSSMGASFDKYPLAPDLINLLPNKVSELIEKMRTLESG